MMGGQAIRSDASSYPDWDDILAAYRKMGSEFVSGIRELDDGDLDGPPKGKVPEPLKDMFTNLGDIGSQRGLNVSRAGSDVEISFETQAGVTYDVVHKTDLIDPSWTLLQSVVGDGTTLSVYDPVSSPAGFYRVESSE